MGYSVFLFENKSLLHLYWDTWQQLTSQISFLIYFWKNASKWKIRNMYAFSFMKSDPKKFNILPSLTPHSGSDFIVWLLFTNNLPISPTPTSTMLQGQTLNKCDTAKDIIDDMIYKLLHGWLLIHLIHRQ